MLRGLRPRIRASKRRRMLAGNRDEFNLENALYATVEINHETHEKEGRAVGSPSLLNGERAGVRSERVRRCREETAAVVIPTPHPQSLSPLSNGVYLAR